MKIVHVSYAYIPEYNNPYEWLEEIQFFTGIVTAMARKHEVHSVHSINYQGVVEHEGSTFHFIKAKVHQHVFPLRSNQYVRKLKPDVVIVHGFHFVWSLIWLRIFAGSRVKIFVQYHAEKPFSFPKKYLQIFADTFIKGYFFTSFDLANEWIDRKLISNISKVYQVMEASSAFHAVEKSVAMEKTGIDKSRIYLWVGRLDHNKDPVTLVSAFVSYAREFSNVRLYIIFTQNDLLDQVKEIIEDCPQIILVGKVPHDELINWYSASDFIISTSHFEGSGIAVCEAISCGCIPILTNISSFRMMSDNGNCGLLFEAGNKKDLLETLKNSHELSIETKRPAVLKQFEKELSFDAIAGKMIEAVSAPTT